MQHCSKSISTPSIIQYTEKRKTNYFIIFDHKNEKIAFDLFTPLFNIWENSQPVDKKRIPNLIKNNKELRTVFIPKSGASFLVFLRKQKDKSCISYTENLVESNRILCSKHNIKKYTMYSIGSTSIFLLCLLTDSKTFMCEKHVLTLGMASTRNAKTKPSPEKQIISTKTIGL